MPHTELEGFFIGLAAKLKKGFGIGSYAPEHFIIALQGDPDDPDRFYWYDDLIILNMDGRFILHSIGTPHGGACKDAAPHMLLTPINDAAIASTAGLTNRGLSEAAERATALYRPTKQFVGMPSCTFSESGMEKLFARAKSLEAPLAIFLNVMASEADDDAELERLAASGMLAHGSATPQNAVPDRLSLD
jgi:hypothetical protein